MRTLLPIGTLALLGLGLQAEAARPNIVLIVTDDHGADALGCYGNPVIRTPALDALCQEGIKFNNAYCTTPSSAASRSVILTGIYNHANGMYGHEQTFHHFSAFSNIKSLPVLLKKAGYRNARVGKYHLAPESVYKFDLIIPADGRNTVEMAQNCEEYIQASDKPFFLYFCPMDPHRSGGIDETSPYRPDLFGNKKEGYPGVEDHVYDPAEVIVPPHLTDTPATRAELAQYYQSVDRVDQGIARLVELLKRHDNYDNTLIMYISDNGQAFPAAKTNIYEAGVKLPCIIKMPGGGQGAGTETDAYINWTDITPTLLDIAGAPIPYDKFAADHDEVLPYSDEGTNAKNLRAPTGIQGRSFKELLLGTQQETSDKVFTSHTFHEITMYYPMRSVRKGDYKLIINFANGLDYPFATDLWASATWQYLLQHHISKCGERPIRDFIKRPRYELYDLSKDPNEVHNLAGKRAYAAKLAELIEEIKQFQIQTKDPWGIKWEHE